MGLIPHDIFNRIKAIPIPISNVVDKLMWKFTTDGNFSVKTATWAINDIIKPHLKLKFLILFGN